MSQHEVTLKNGAKEARELVQTCMFSLSRLLSQDPLSFFGLVMHCRDESYRIEERAEKVLKASGFVAPTGDIHNSVKNVVLSAVVGDEADMRIVNAQIGNCSA